ncbi:MAG: PTS sugar transporter subunit IIA [Chitinivibrionales bacterium]|nr:PTS sugar transporter subunit IIA [Chitinivibrionales bacterium]
MKQSYPEQTIASILSVDDIFFTPEIDKQSVITFLFDKLQVKHQFQNGKKVHRELFNREELMPTGLGCGVALPHVATSQAKSFYVNCAIVKNGVAWNSFDNLPVRIIILVVFPVHERQNYLRLVANLSAILKDSRYRTAIEQASEALFVYDILSGKNR